jgi:Rrf2 family protein
MKISTRGDYGIRAMLELARRYGEGYVQSSEIAAARYVPEKYLCQLLILLRKAGLIKSRRGPRGGHALARPPDQISLADAVIALEGPWVPVSCVQEGMVNDCPCSDDCPVRDIWLRVTQITRRILEETTLDRLAEKERQKRLARAQMQ